MSSDMTIPVFTLCDSATVREGLLNVLGAGLTAIHRDGEYPNAIGAHIAAMVVFKGKDAPPRLVLSITTSAGESIGVEELNLGPVSNDLVPPESNLIYTIPITINVSE